MQDDFDSELAAMRRADAVARRRYYEEQERRQRKEQRQHERELDERRRERELKYFVECASGITSLDGRMMEEGEIREVAEALKFIHDSQLGLLKGWPVARWFAEECKRAGVSWLERRDFFRQDFFEPILIASLRGKADALLYDIERGREKAHAEGRSASIPWHVYHHAILDIVEFLDSGGKLARHAWEIHNELRGFASGEKPAHSVFNLSGRQILECAARYDNRIDVQLTRLAPERVLCHVGRIDAVKVEGVSSKQKALKV